MYLPNKTMVEVTKVLVSASDYSTNEVLSESASAGTAWTFAACSRAAGLGGLITKAQIGWGKAGGITAQTNRMTLFLFKAAPTCATNDNVTNTALLHADKSNYVGRIDFPALISLGGDSEAIATPSTSGNLPIEFLITTGTSLYGILVTLDATSSVTAGADMTIKLFIEQD